MLALELVRVQSRTTLLKEPCTFYFEFSKPLWVFVIVIVIFLSRLLAC